MVMSWQDQGQLGHGKWWPGTMALPLLPPVVMEAVHNCTGAGTHTHHHGVSSSSEFLGFVKLSVRHYINWGILLSLFRKIPKIPKTTPVDGFQHVRGQYGVVFHAQSNGEVSVQIS